MSKKHLVIVLTEPTEEMEEDFNQYYEHTHLDEVIDSTGFKSAQRFKLVDQVGEECPLPYLAVYETEADDSESILNTLNYTRNQRQQSKSINKRTARIWVYQETGPEHTLEHSPELTKEE